MGFELGGDSRQVPQLIAELSATVSVLRWQVYCTVDYGATTRR